MIDSFWLLGIMVQWPLPIVHVRRIRDSTAMPERLDGSFSSVMSLLSVCVLVVPVTGSLFVVVRSRPLDALCLDVVGSVIEYNTCMEECFFRGPSLYKPWRAELATCRFPPSSLSPSILHRLQQRRKSSLNINNPIPRVMCEHEV